MKMLATAFALCLAAASLAPAARAQAPAAVAPMAPGMAMPQAAAAAESPSTAAFKAADDRMMQGMAKPMTGDADQDFVAGMIPHHIGAVDMAKVELHYGHDPQLRRLAHAIIASQDRQIAQMQAWQKAHAR